MLVKVTRGSPDCLAASQRKILDPRRVSSNDRTLRAPMRCWIRQRSGVRQGGYADLISMRPTDTHSLPTSQPRRQRTAPSAGTCKGVWIR